MNEVTKASLFEFFKSNNKTADVYLDSLFNEIASTCDDIFSIIQVLEKLTIIDNSFYKKEVNHFGENGVLFSNGCYVHNDRRISNYTYFNNNDNNIVLFNYSIDNEGDIHDINADFKISRGNLKTVHLTLVENKPSGMIAYYPLDISGKEDAKVQIYKQKSTYCIRNNEYDNPYIELTETEFAKKINSLRKQSPINKLIGITEKVLMKYSELRNKEIFNK